VLAHGQADAGLLLVARQRQVGVEQVVRALASPRACAATTSTIISGQAKPVIAPSAPRVSSSGRNRPPPLPVRMDTRFKSPLSLAARMADSLASPGQSSCLSITQWGEFFRMRRMTPVDICTVVETGWSCRHHGTLGPSVSLTMSKYEAIWSSVRTVAAARP
jgi:hypothetical protein